MDVTCPSAPAYHFENRTLMIKAAVVLAILIFGNPVIGQTFSVHGIMRHTNLEGGCWYLEDESGKHYELIGDSALIESIREDGREVRLNVEHAKGAASICMVGDIVRVLQITSPLKGPYDPPYGDILIVGTMKRTSDGAWYILSNKRVKYEFQEAPPKSLRHVGKHVNQTFHVIMDPRSSKHHMDGIIMPNVKPPKRTKFPLKKYDPK